MAETRNEKCKCKYFLLKMRIAIIVLSLSLLVKCQSNTCPPAEDIKPCSCLLGHDRRAAISCENIKSSKELIKAVSSMKGYSLSSFNLEKSDINILPSDAFSDMEIDSINIRNCNLTKLGESRNQPPFLGLQNSLQSLLIKDSFPNENMPLTTLTLSHLKKLNVLTLEGNFIPVIGNNWFENGPYGLKQLLLLNSNTSIIGSHAFEAFDNLQYFSLTGGSLSQIPRETLPMPAKFLRSLNLRKNKLTSFPLDFFSKMPALEEILLDNNYLTTIEEAVWAPIWSQLDYIYFHGNPIRCDKNIKWIYKYRLPENFGGYCTSPPRLLHKNLRLLTISDLQE